MTVKVTNYYAGGTYELDQAGVVPLKDHRGRQANGSILIAGTITRKYYAFAGQTVAMVECSSQGCGDGLEYFLTDHLGSVAAVVNASGGLVSRQGYYPYGGIRTDVGMVIQTDFGYTGQRNLDAQGNSYRLGLMDYREASPKGIRRAFTMLIFTTSSSRIRSRQARAVPLPCGPEEMKV